MQTPGTPLPHSILRFPNHLSPTSESRAPHSSSGFDSSFGSTELAEVGLRNSDFRARGFTLVELLVVIGIIAILIGITLPIIGKLRYAAYTADTQNEISQLSTACSQYYTTYHAYPGPFSNDDISGGTTSAASGTQSGWGTGLGNPTLIEYYLNGTYSPVGNDSAATTPWTVTGAQNLVLGLMGGLRVDTQTSGLAVGHNIAFAPAEVGLGPLSLNPANPARAQSFWPAGSTYLMWCQQNNGQNVQSTGNFQNLGGGAIYNGTSFTDVAGGAALDAPIPVFVDRFPSPGPLPILYLRARVGAPGIIWDNYSGLTANAYYQYDLRDIYPYVKTHIGLVAKDNATGMLKTHNLIGFSAFPPNMVVKSNDLAPFPTQVQNGGPYFMNTAITPTNSLNDQTTNMTGRPRAVDQFILISAGPDGVYGTTDDITSFGSVSN